MVLILALAWTLWVPSVAEDSWTTVFVVRHAEKGTGSDPPLSEAGRARSERLAALLSDAGIDAAYSTQYRRTRQTVRPLAEAAGVEPVVVRAQNPAELIRRILTDHRGRQVVVAGHSNTVPELVAGLGAPHPGPIAESEYHHLFVVTIASDDTATVVQLRY